MGQQLDSEVTVTEVHCQNALVMMIPIRPRSASESEMRRRAAPRLPPGRRAMKRSGPPWRRFILERPI
jgi:hypothetical protein